MGHTAQPLLVVLQVFELFRAWQGWQGCAGLVDGSPDEAHLGRHVGHGVDLPPSQLHTGRLGSDGGEELVPDVVGRGGEATGAGMRRAIQEASIQLREVFPEGLGGGHEPRGVDGVRVRRKQRLGPDD